MIRKLVTAAITATALMASGASGQPAKKAPPRPAGGLNWAVTSTATPEGHHLLGNPAAKLRLIQFVSYTCPHCAHFETESEGQLKIGMIAPGKGAVEVRNFVRDPVDMTVALITNCAPPSRFFQLHTAFMRLQPQWIGPLTNSTEAQRQRWFTGPFASRTRAIASDFKLYQFMASRGMDRQTMDRCLANEALANKLAKQTDYAAETLGVTGTPSFMIDGILLAGTHDWNSLRPQILARLD